VVLIKINNIYILSIILILFFIKTNKLNESSKEEYNIEPILIKANGVGGVEGYVRKSDLYNEKNQPQNPEEAIVYMKEYKQNKVRVIPLYDSDGKTIIGTYEISRN